MANTCEINVGRLMEIRVADGYRSVRDVDRMIAQMRARMSALDAGAKCVIAADWRMVSMMAPETAARAREMLAGSNPRVIRSAILCSPDQSLTHLQVVRLIREAESPSRRHFTSADEQYRWLAEVLTEPERARLAQFLSMRPSEPRGVEPPRSLPQLRGAAPADGAGAARSERQRLDPAPGARASVWPSLLDPGRRTTPPGDSDP